MSRADELRPLPGAVVNWLTENELTSTIIPTTLAANGFSTLTAIKTLTAEHVIIVINLNLSAVSHFAH
jgi:hypothetical protein